MKYAVDALILLIIVVVLVFGELYLKMDRNRAVARQCLKKLTVPLSDWVACTEKIVAAKPTDTHLSADLEAAIRNYKSLTNAQLFEIPGAINEVHRITKMIASDDADNPAIAAAGKELTDIFTLIIDTVDRHNISVYKLDLQLNKAFFGTVGKVFKFQKMTHIESLVVL